MTARPIDATEERLGALARELALLRARVEALEAERTGNATSALPASTASAGPAHRHRPTEGATASAAGAMALSGRTLVVLGGAYLLRTLTDAAVIPAGFGAAAGLGYAVAWLWRSDRAARSGRRPSAVFHALAAAGMAFALLWEATTRFALLPAPAGAALLVALLGLGLAVAWRHGLGVVASTFTLAALVTGFGLLVRTRELVPFTLGLLLVAGAVESLAWDGHWAGLRWPAALTVDAATWLTVEMLTRPEGIPEGYPPASRAAAAAVVLLLPLVYAASGAMGLLVRGRGLTLFDVVQAVAALVLGLGGGTRLLASAGSTRAGAALLALVLGVAAYAAAFAVLGPRGRRDATFHFHASAGLVLALVGTGMLLTGPPQALAFTLLAVAAAALSSRFQPTTLAGHSAACLLVAAGSAGLLGAMLDALLAPAERTWREPTLAGLAVALGGTLTYAGLMVRRSPATGAFPRVLVAALLSWTVAALGVRSVVGSLGPGPGSGADPGVVATVRTLAAAGLALALAAASRRRGLEELGWLVYPALAGGGLKLLLEDLPSGRPATLFVALSVYGGALIAAPRMLRRGVPPGNTLKTDS